MENIFLVIISFIVLMFVLALARVVFTYVLDIVAHGILPFLIVLYDGTLDGIYDCLDFEYCCWNNLGSVS